MTGSTRSSTGCTRWSELGSKVSLLTAIVFALLVVACSPSGPAPEPSATINESASSTVVSSSASSDESNDQENGQGPWIIRWLVALGPSGPVGNGDLGHETYSHLREGDCQDAAAIQQRAATQEELLYGGAGNACLAAFNGRTDLWPEAETALASFKPQNFDFTCYDRAVYQILKTLIDLHHQDPNRGFDKASSGATPDVCPRLTALDPSSGPLTGGYEIAVLGENLTNEVTVRLDYSSDESLEARAQPDGRRLTFTMPSARDPGEVWVVVTFDGVDSALPFVYTENSAGSDSSDGSSDDDATDKPSDQATDESSDQASDQATAEPSDESS